jgi:predicted Zn-dependent peptidase
MGEEGLSLPVQEFKLNNGLTVLLLERHHSPSVACQIGFKAGSNNERNGITGSAHMLEHMMFKGTKTIGTRDYNAEIPIMEEMDRAANEMLDERLKGDQADAEKMESLAKRLKELQEQQRPYVVGNELGSIYKRQGGSGMNAYTSDDYTNYIIKLPSNKVELWCWMESDRIANPVFREFYAEKEVVREERRMRYETDPDGSLWELFSATAYQAHPYGWMTIGWPSDIENYRRATMQEFFTRYYAPGNAVIVWVGDFKTDEALAMIRHYFEPIPGQEPPPPVVTIEPEQKGERRAVLEFDANPSLVMGWHTVALDNPDQAPLNLIQGLLSDGRTSRLYQRLRQDEQLASSVMAYQDTTEYPGMFIVAAAPVEGVTSEKVETVLEEQIARLCDEPVSDWELQRVKNQLRADFVISMESNYELARELTEYECKRNWKLLFEEDRRQQAVSAEDVQRVARKYLIPSNRSVVTLKSTSSKEKT